MSRLFTARRHVFKITMCPGPKGPTQLKGNIDMAEAAKKTRAHPPKQFHVPADIAALGQYGQTIKHAMHSEHNSRMSRAFKRKVAT